MPGQRFRVSTEIKKLLLLEALVDYRPEYDPYIYLARSYLAKDTLRDLPGRFEQFVGVSSYLVPLEYQEKCKGKFRFGEFPGAGRGYFNSDGNYETAEQFTEDEVSLEIIVRDRFFEGLGLSYYEPTDKLVVYLQLHRQDREWINPYTGDVVIKSGDGTRGWEPHDEFLALRHSDLVDYLAARKCGLVVVRYGRCELETPFDLLGLPRPFERQTTHGRQCWVAEKSRVTPGQNTYLSQVWESFWVPPASKPRRWDASPPREFKDGVPFVLADGETSTFGPDRERYFDILSFRGDLIRSFTTLAANRLEWYSLTTCGLRYADGTHLDGCINSDAQFQSLFGSVAKLDTEKQRHLSAYSEPQKAKPSYEFIRNQFYGEWTDTRPLGWTLSEALKEVNAPWRNRFGKALLLDPEEADIPDILGPAGADFGKLTDLMLELNKAVIPEGDISGIKSGLDIRDPGVPANDYQQMRSIGFTRLLFRRFRADGQEGEAQVLMVINELRRCKAHPNDLGDVLNRHGLDELSPRSVYLAVLKGLCLFLARFRTVTESALGVEVHSEPREPVHDPWQQLDIVRTYCEKPF